MPVPAALAVVAPVVRPHTGALTGAAALALLSAGATLVRPWPLALAIDYAIDGQPATGALAWVSDLSPQTVLVLAALAVVLITVLAGLLDMAVAVFGEGAAERVGAALRQRIFDRSMSLSLRWHDRMRSGALVPRLTSDVGRVLDGLVACVTGLVPDLVTVVVVLAVLASFDPGLTLVGLAVVPVLAVLALRQRRRVRAANERARTESGDLAATANDLLRNVRAVQAFGRARRAHAMFGVRNDALLRAESAAVTVEARWTPVADAVLAIGSALVLVVGGGHVLSGELSTGDLLVVLAYVRELYSPVRGLARLSGVLAKAGASAARVREVLDCVEEVRQAPDARPAPRLTDEVRFERVWFGYEEDRPVLGDVNLTVRAGETVCLLGPSGIGKSTVLHLLLRLYDVDAGRVLVDGVDIRACDLHSLRRRIAFVPQDPWLLDVSVAENIAFGSPNATRAGVLAAGRLALVDEFVGTLPRGYETPLGEGGSRLSGGQRRRVAIARAAVSEAPLVLLDEPTASLDPESAATVIRAIRGVAATRTVLIVTHDRELATIADRVVVLGETPDSMDGGDSHDPRQDADVAPRRAFPQPLA